MLKIKPNFKCSTYIEDEEGREWEVKVIGMFYPGDPGRYSGPPEICYEGYPDELEIWEMKTQYPFELEEFHRDSIFEQAMEQAQIEYSESEYYEPERD